MNTIKTVAFSVAVDYGISLGNTITSQYILDMFPLVTNTQC